MKVYKRVELRGNTLDDAAMLCLVKLSNVKIETHAMNQCLVTSNFLI